MRVPGRTNASKAMGGGSVGPAEGLPAPSGGGGAVVPNSSAASASGDPGAAPVGKGAPVNESVRNTAAEVDLSAEDILAALEYDEGKIEEAEEVRLMSIRCLSLRGTCEHLIYFVM
jgi:hypothetical protein